MAIIGTFEPYRDVNSIRVGKAFAEFASTKRDLDRAKKGKSAQFVSQKLSIADLTKRLSKVGRILNHQSAS